MPKAEEQPRAVHQEVCGINGCTSTWDDPEVMRKHKHRMHGVGEPPNLNRPLPRNANAENRLA